MKRIARPLLLTLFVSSPAFSAIAQTYSYQGGNYGQSLGGSSAGAAGHDGNSNSPDAGSGAQGSSVSVTLSGNNNYPDIVISTDGAPGVTASSKGGVGGAGGQETGDGPAYGGIGGNGGGGSPATVTATGQFSVTTSGDNAIGIQALSIGGAGGDADDSDVHQPGAWGGYGGPAGAVTVDLSKSASTIHTEGTASSGIFAASTGGAAGSSGTNYDTDAPPQTDGVSGGSSGVVGVTIVSGTSIRTVGDSSSGIVARSVGGVGGSGGSVAGDVTKAIAGNGANGGNTGTVTVTTNGQITTSGVGSFGILAQAISGAGGAGGSAQSATVSHAGSAGNGGAVGDITVTNSGTITTFGSYAAAILAQSLSGSGGIGGDSTGLFNSEAGGAGPNNSGGAITASSTGSIQTGGDNAHGIVAQSLGGGGGMGGIAGGMIYTNAGDGGSGGSGGAATITVSGSLTTAGQTAHGAVAQSVGGGGGMGGAATSAGVNLTTAVGGVGGLGGSGGAATIHASNLTLQTTGSGSRGLMAASIGGGGGSGGGAYSTSAGMLADVSVAVGGSGGNGGNGDTATVTISGSTLAIGGNINGYPSGAIDSVGVHVQSIGGGGGNGGAGSATAYAIAVANPAESPLSKITFSGAFAVGGTGGDGGNGGNATGSVGSGSSITVMGDGGSGAIVQSVGGGGGNGGDSSALSATIGYGLNIPNFSNAATPATNAINVSVSVGGTAGVGGNGGSASFTVGDNDTATTKLSTWGDVAPAILVQSVGGGGGNAGVGNSGVKNFATSQDVAVTLQVGAEGGAGGTGSDASVTVAANGVVETHGDGSAAVIAQSVGGGGGIGSGSALNVTGLDSWVTAVFQVNPSLEVDDKGNKIAPGFNHNRSYTLGASGAAGGAGGTVTVTQNGSISTVGKDAPAILAQSIGGGGGVVGSAGATSDTGTSNATSSMSVQPMAPTLLGDSSNDNPWSVTVPVTLHSTVTIGGHSGAGGDGGTVTINASGTVSTSDDYSSGMIAQSIGGGGGRAGVANIGAESGGALAQVAPVSTLSKILLGGGVNGSTVSPDFEAAVDLGSGGTVTVTLDNASIQTGPSNLASEGPPSTTDLPGFQAFGILAQSIGGGGGLAIDGSADPNVVASLGAFSDGGSDPGMFLTGGAGGPVTLTDQGNSLVLTIGDAAHAIVLQSIAGGGGVVGAGVSELVPSGGSERKVEVALGAAGSWRGDQAISASAGAVTATFVSNIRTYGSGAFGLVAQSIGGGGGLVGASQGVNLSVKGLGSSTSSILGDGGTVTVGIQSPDSSLYTYAVGAHGVVAQSIGGGGGLVASYQPGEVPVFTSTAPVPASPFGEGDGGDVSVTLNTSIGTGGAGAHGVIAQSIGGGGGLTALAGQVFMGTTSTGEYQGDSGTVTVQTQGVITATGENAAGIVAQSSSPGQQGTITITIGGDSPGTVSGGSGAQGVGILVIGGNTNNTITIGENSWVWAESGAAIKSVGKAGSQKLDVTNNGQIYGDTWLNGGSIDGNFQNTNGTPPNQFGGTLLNAGTLTPVAGATSYIDGHLTQTASGRIAPHLDFSNLRSGRYVVTGNARLDGTITPTLATALPNVYLPVLQVNGTATGSLSAPDSPLFSYTLRETAQRYDVAITDAHFTDPRFGLTAHKSGLATSLQTMFMQGNPQLGTYFAALDGIAGQGPAAYQNALGQLSPRSVMTLFARGATDASRIADASMSCPKFGGAGTGDGAQAFLSEGACAYFMTRGQTTGLSGDHDRGSSRLDAAAWQAGAQTHILPDLLLGGSIAYQASRFSGRDGVSATGSTVEGALTLKYQTGGWLLSGAMFGSFASYDVKRSLALPGYATLGSGDAPFYTAGIRARAAYTFGADTFYVRPYLNLDLVHARNGAFTENGTGDLGLRINEGNYSTAVLTPALEIGGRTELGNGMSLRSFVSAGASFRSNDQWKGYASFKGAYRQHGFAIRAPIDTASARVGAGVQLFQNEHFDFRFQYDGEFAQKAVSHGATASVSYRF